MTRLDIFRAAVQAKLDFWNALRALEIEMGFEEIPDDVSDYIYDQLEDLAAGCDNIDWIDERQLAEFSEGIPRDD